MKKAGVLRKAIQSGHIVPLPGIFDCWGARVVEDIGFPGAYISGLCLAGTMGFPDIGIATMSEVVRQAGYIADAVNIPVIADADTGYGSYVNVARTIKAFEKSGIAGVHIEDQLNPKKCGALPGIELTSKEEMIGRIKAAVDARVDQDFIVIARTDAPGVYGIQETIDRCNAFISAGADVSMVIGPMSKEDITQIGSKVRGTKLAVIYSSGLAPSLSLRELEKMGYHLAILPIQLLQYQIGASYKFLKAYKDSGSLGELMKEMADFNELKRLQKLEEYQNAEAKYQKRK